MILVTIVLLLIVILTTGGVSDYRLGSVIGDGVAISVGEVIGTVMLIPGDGLVIRGMLTTVLGTGDLTILSGEAIGRECGRERVE